jgi:hypothetical protein
MEENKDGHMILRNFYMHACMYVCMYVCMLKDVETTDEINTAIV